MASVARDMSIASLLVILTSAAIVGWGMFRADALSQASDLASAETGYPGAFTVSGSSRPDGARGDERRTVLIRLAAYQPPQQGTVQVVVKALREGAQPVELGRFAVFPNTAFTLGSDASQRTYSVPARACPSEPGLACTLRLEVSLAPVAGTGDGARITVASASIDWR